MESKGLGRIDSWQQLNEVFDLRDALQLGRDAVLLVELEVAAKHELTKPRLREVMMISIFTFEILPFSPCSKCSGVACRSHQ